jgi:hypothetical protein
MMFRIAALVVIVCGVTYCTASSLGSRNAHGGAYHCTSDFGTRFLQGPAILLVVLATAFLLCSFTSIWISMTLGLASGILGLLALYTAALALGLSACAPSVDPSTNLVFFSGAALTGGSFLAVPFELVRVAVRRYLGENRDGGAQSTEPVASLIGAMVVPLLLLLFWAEVTEGIVRQVLGGLFYCNLIVAVIVAWKMISNRKKRELGS